MTGATTLKHDVGQRQVWGRSSHSPWLIDLISLLQELHATGVDLYLHQQGINTTTPAGKALFQMNRSAHHNGGEWERMHYAVRLGWTRCGFGGRRVWWRCPAVGCRRRVAVLHGGRVFAWRQCNRRAYRSQREADDDPAARRADTEEALKSLVALERKA